jgi:hypothetical protein
MAEVPDDVLKNLTAAMNRMSDVVDKLSGAGDSATGANTATASAPSDHDLGRELLRNKMIYGDNAVLSTSRQPDYTFNEATDRIIAETVQGRFHSNLIAQIAQIAEEEAFLDFVSSLPQGRDGTIARLNNVLWALSGKGASEKLKALKLLNKRLELSRKEKAVKLELDQARSVLKFHTPGSNEYLKQTTKINNLDATHKWAKKEHAKIAQQHEAAERNAFTLLRGAQDWQQFKNSLEYALSTRGTMQKGWGLFLSFYWWGTQQLASGLYQLTTGREPQISRTIDLVNPNYYKRAYIRAGHKKNLRKAVQAGYAKHYAERVKELRDAGDEEQLKAYQQHFRQNKKTARQIRRWEKSITRYGAHRKLWTGLKYYVIGTSRLSHVFYGAKINGGRANWLLVRVPISTAFVLGAWSLLSAPFINPTMYNANIANRHEFSALNFHNHVGPYIYNTAAPAAWSGITTAASFGWDIFHPDEKFKKRHDGITTVGQQYFDAKRDLTASLEKQKDFETKKSNLVGHSRISAAALNASEHAEKLLGSWSVMPEIDRSLDRLLYQLRSRTGLLKDAALIVGEPLSTIVSKLPPKSEIFAALETGTRQEFSRALFQAFIKPDINDNDIYTVVLQRVFKERLDALVTAANKNGDVDAAYTSLRNAAAMRDRHALDGGGRMVNAVTQTGEPAIVLLRAAQRGGVKAIEDAFTSPDIPTHTLQQAAGLLRSKLVASRPLTTHGGKATPPAAGKGL